MSYSNEVLIGIDDEIITLAGASTCSICLEDICPSDAIEILNCEHVFHKKCLKKWKKMKPGVSNCPLCRDTIENSSIGDATTELSPLNTMIVIPRHNHRLNVVAVIYIILSMMSICMVVVSNDSAIIMLNITEN
jgi:hypothetical protein